MKVVSIDAGPAKGGTVFDGEFKQVAATDLPDFCKKLSEQSPILLCWDAPLTGPPYPDGPNDLASAYTQRLIERFFAQSKGDKAPKGISVLPYSGCPHWTITRASLGLPRLGEYDFANEQLPFPLVHSVGEINPSKSCAVEIHPAVAIWLWCRNSHSTEWIYKDKKDKEIISTLWKILLPQWKAMGIAQVADVTNELSVPKNDDELDAIVGWVLGTLLLEKHDSVSILGDGTTGSNLLCR